jgi:hypothetical protein
MATARRVFLDDTELSQYENIDGLQGRPCLQEMAYQHLRTRRVIAKMQMLIIID